MSGEVMANTCAASHQGEREGSTNNEMNNEINGRDPKKLDKCPIESTGSLSHVLP